MATMNPYLNFQGNTEEAFNFYRSVFGGEFTAAKNGANPADVITDMIYQRGDGVEAIDLLCSGLPVYA